MTETTMTDQASQARDERAANDAALVPPVQVIENAQGITLYADLPGVSKESLELNIEHDTVTIEGRLALDVPEGLEVTHAEVSIPRFRRVFTLSKELDSNKIAAELVNGVLTLRIPKAEHAQPRRIPVSG
jgi:HSP20 family molecular chaperone IbpA